MKPFTFDRFVRLLLVVAALLAVYATFRYLSSVLLPFLVAGVLAYMLNPVCDFLQVTCRLRIRVLCVIITLLLAAGVVGGLLWVCVPPMFEECFHLQEVAIRYLRQGTENASIPPAVRAFFETYVLRSDMYDHLQSGDVTALLKNTLPRIWDLLCSTFGLVVSVVSSLIGLLYLFFLLLDYHRYAAGWISFVPVRYRLAARRLVDDVAFYMCGYFRGQLLIALSNCIMFTVGFLVIGFPMPLALGCFIGIISFVPYLQVIGIIPAAALALLQAAESGENFWVLLGGVLGVYIVVQIIQDVLVTPRVMGRIMGLSPAVILLALSVGAFIGGIGGLIVALPVTTLAMTYYKRYIVQAEGLDEKP